MEGETGWGSVQPHPTDNNSIQFTLKEKLCHQGFVWLHRTRIMGFFLFSLFNFFLYRWIHSRVAVTNAPRNWERKESWALEGGLLWELFRWKVGCPSWLKLCLEKFEGLLLYILTNAKTLQDYLPIRPTHCRMIVFSPAGYFSLSN